MSIYLNKNVNNFANNQKVRKFANKLCSPGALLPVAMMETAVTLGRTYQAQKRGGVVESRERFTEEVVSGIVWLFGMQWLNKGFDVLIDKVGKVKQKTGVKDFNFDTGKDSVRKPFAYATKGMGEKSKTLVSGLKFTKIAASAVLAIGFMGYVLPKVNQKITNIMLEKKKNNTRSNSSKIEQISEPRVNEMDKFLKEARGKANSKTQFKGGGDFFQMAAHQLENNQITQLSTMEVGLFTGRAVNARNKYERREILFRDISSAFFYVAATPVIYNGLLKLDALKGKNTHVSPEGAHKLDAEIRKVYGSKESMSTVEFKKKIFGERQVEKSVLSDAKAQFKGNEITIDVDEMHKFIDEKVGDKSLAKGLKEKAIKLSAIQPELDGRKILTRSQMDNLFHNGLMNDPEIITPLINDATGKVAMNPIKFISHKKVDKHRVHIKDYVESIIEQANKDGTKEISKEFLTKMKNRNLVSKLGYWGVGMAISAYFLSTGIPKMQYHMTKEATGRNDFPGVTKYDE